MGWPFLTNTQLGICGCQHCYWHACVKFKQTILWWHIFDISHCLSFIKIIHHFRRWLCFCLWVKYRNFEANSHLYNICFMCLRWQGQLAKCGMFLTHWRQLTQKCMIAHPCVVDRSRISAFSYMTSNTCVFELVWHTERFKAIISYMQDVWISSYKQTDRSWTLF